MSCTVLGTSTSYQQTNKWATSHFPLGAYSDTTYCASTFDELLPIRQKITPASEISTYEILATSHLRRASWRCDAIGCRVLTMPNNKTLPEDLKW